MRVHILLIDEPNESRECQKIARTLTKVMVTAVRTVAEALLSAKDYDVVVFGLSDPAVKTPKEEVETLCRRFGRTKVVVLGNAGQRGICEVEFIERPFGEAQLDELIDRHLRGMSEFIGASPGMRGVFDLIRKAARTNISVLITGESGTGKEVAAKAIHACSARADKPFVAINCAAIPQELLESELFGHRKGAFTGAVTERRGLFMEANQGTILLDEIGDLPLSLQGKLLRLLQTREVRPIGQNESVKVDIRIVAATHKDLRQLMRMGQFREDLFYRLNVIPIEMPALRERREDIRPLAEHFLKTSLPLFDCGPKTFAEETLGILMRAAWIGNIRELENVVLRSIMVSTGPLIEPHDILIESEAGALERVTKIDGSMVTLDELERDYIQYVLARTENKSEAADVLGIDRKTLYNKEKKYGLGNPSKVKLLRSLVTLIAAFFVANLALAAEPEGSAAREPGESWEQAARRHRVHELEFFAGGTPESQAHPIEEIGVDLARLPEWPGSIAGIRDAFARARDERFYEDSHGLLRRSSWMYPDDGCFVRASHVAKSLERAGLVRPGKVFAFGNLKMTTSFHPRGAVYWWYHVAPAYRKGNLVIVLDPAAHHDRPLLLHEWVALISRKPETTKIALCDTNAYMAAQTCVGGSPDQERGQQAQQRHYLSSEWSRLVRLRMAPLVTLQANTRWGEVESYRLPPP
ncbi:MAG: sigma 54-interacting transcriptional regulator [Bdellovibrionota bacterium]